MSEPPLLIDRGAMAADGCNTRRAARRKLVGANALDIPSIGTIASVDDDSIFSAITGHKAAPDAHHTLNFGMDGVIETRQGIGCGVGPPASAELSVGRSASKR